MRTVPVLGLAALWFQRAERLRIADEEDEAYTAMMEAMDAQPHFAGATRARETRIIIGQLVGCLVATALGTGMAILAHVAWPLLVVVTWGLALALDAVGARLSASLSDRAAEAQLERITSASDRDHGTDTVHRDM